MLPARVNTEELAQIVWMTTPAHAQLELQGNLAKSVSEYVCLKGLRLGLDFYSLLSSSSSSSSLILLLVLVLLHFLFIIIIITKDRIGTTRDF